MAEGDVAVTGDDDKTQALSSPFTAQQDEQIAAFFEKHKLFYGMADGDYKNKKKHAQHKATDHDFLTLISALARDNHMWLPCVLFIRC